MIKAKRANAVLVQSPRDPHHVRASVAPGEAVHQQRDRVSRLPGLRPIVVQHQTVAVRQADFVWYGLVRPGSRAEKVAEQRLTMSARKQSCRLEWRDCDQSRLD